MGSRRVLIADPDTRAAALVARGLRKDGFEAAVASSLAQAQGLLCEPVHLAFAHAGAPGLDCTELSAAVRLSPSAEAPIILFSREDDPRLRERVRAAAGADDLLQKPFYVRDACTLARLFARAGGIEGALSEQPLFFLLRALTSGGRSGQIELPDDKGSVSFRDGRIVEASCAGLGGEDALARLLLLARGSFRLKLGLTTGRVSMSLSLRDLVLREGPRRARFERAIALLGGETARLEVQLQAVAGAIPKLPPSIERLVRLFDGRRTMSQALSACDLEEVTAAESVLRLKLLGVLAQAPEGREAHARLESSFLELSPLLPDAAPLFIPELPPSTAPEVRDWLTELARREGDEDVLADDTGGWAELPTDHVGRQLLELGGDDVEREIEQRIGQLDRVQAVDSTVEAPRAALPAPSRVPRALALTPLEASLSSDPRGSLAQGRRPEARAEDAAPAPLFTSPGFWAPMSAPISQEAFTPGPQTSFGVEASPVGAPPAAKAPLVEVRDAWTSEASSSRGVSEALPEDVEAQFFASAPESGPPLSAPTSQEEFAPAPQTSFGAEASPAGAPPAAKAPLVEARDSWTSEVSPSRGVSEPLPDEAEAQFFASAPEPGAPLPAPISQEEFAPAPQTSLAAKASTSGAPPAAKASLLEPRQSWSSGASSSHGVSEALPDDAAQARFFGSSPEPRAPLSAPMSQEAFAPAAPSLGASASPVGVPPAAKAPVVQAREAEALADGAEAQFFASAPEHAEWEATPPRARAARRPVRPVRGRGSRKALIAFGAFAAVFAALLAAIYFQDSARPPRPIALTAEKITTSARPEPLAPTLSPPAPPEALAASPLSAEGGSPSLAGPAEAQEAGSEREGTTVASKPDAGLAAAGALAGLPWSSRAPVASEPHPSAVSPGAPQGAGAASGIEGLLAEGRRLYASGRPEAAIRPFQAAAAAAPGDPRIHVLLALAHYDAGKPGEAGKAARRAIALEPGNARAHLILGTVYADERQAGRARAEYETYLKLAPGGEFARDVRTILKTLQR
jgi:CheY-like chemotaxis protein